MKVLSGIMLFRMSWFNAHATYILFLGLIIFRSAISTYGLWHQDRVDHGREFYLVLYIQEYLRRTRGPRDIHPYV